MSIKQLSMFVCVAVTTAMQMLFAAPSVTEVTARQRYPWNGMVDISCTAGGVVAGKNRTTVTATDLAAGTNVTVATLSVAGAAVENGAFSLAADRIKADYDMIANREFLRYSPVMTPAAGMGL